MIDELDESAVLTTRDVEKLLKIPRQTQIDLRARGGFIPHFFVGHKVLYRKDAVLRWIAEAEAKAAGDLAPEAMAMAAAAKDAPAAEPMAVAPMKDEDRGGGSPPGRTASQSPEDHPHPHDPAVFAADYSRGGRQGASPEAGAPLPMQRRHVRLRGRMLDENFRHNTTLTELRNDGFRAKWAGACAGCPRPIRKGQRVHYQANLLCHVARVPDGRFREPRKTATTPKVKGARQPTLCPHCHCEHSGDCW